jgi:hypothetical protein
MRRVGAIGLVVGGWPADRAGAAPTPGSAATRNEADGDADSETGSGATGEARRLWSGAVNALAASGFGLVATDAEGLRVWTPEGALAAAISFRELDQRVGARGALRPGVGAMDALGSDTVPGAPARVARRMTATLDADPLGAFSVLDGQPLTLGTPVEWALAYPEEDDLDGVRGGAFPEETEPSIRATTGAREASSDRSDDRSDDRSTDRSSEAAAGFGPRPGRWFAPAGAARLWPGSFLGAGGRAAWLVRSGGLWRIDLAGGAAAVSRGAPELSDVEAVAASPDGGQVVVAAATELYRSADGGETFRAVARIAGSLRGLAVNRSGEVLFVDAAGGRLLSAGSAASSAADESTRVRSGAHPRPIAAGDPPGLDDGLVALGGEPVDVVDVVDVVACADHFLVGSRRRVRAVRRAVPVGSELDGVLLPAGATHVACTPGGREVAFGSDVWTRDRRARDVWVARGGPTDSTIEVAAFAGHTAWLGTASGIWSIAASSSSREEPGPGRGPTPAGAGDRCGTASVPSPAVDVEADAGASVAGSEASGSGDLVGSAAWLGLRTALPRLSAVLAAERGSTGTNLLGYVTATFTLDRQPLADRARATFRRMAARHLVETASRDAALARLIGGACVSPAERQALRNVWKGLR